MRTLEVRSLYYPRAYQEELYEGLKAKKRAIAVFHRRAGKDLACWNILIMEAIKKRGIYYYIFPTYRQARRSLWEAIDNEGHRFLEYLPKEFIKGKPSHTEMKLELINGSIIRFLGSDNYDDIRGVNTCGVVLSEFAYQRPEIWTSILEPVLTANGGWALFNSTPFGKNHFYGIYEYARQHPSEWYSKVLTISDTGLVTQAQIEQLKASGTSEETIQQEYYCSFTRGVEGSYYARLLNEIRLKGQIGNVIYDRYANVHTAWDLGVGDSTAIWFFQVIGAGEIHFIDYYEASGESLEHYIRVLEERQRVHKYRYGQHFAPHDIQARELGTGTTRLHVAAELGIDFVVLPAKPVHSGIEIVRKLLPHSWFDEKHCDIGLNALENYCKRYDEKNRVYSDSPLHNWASHGADAARYAFTAIQDYLGRGVGTSLTPESLADIKKKAYGREQHEYLGGRYD